MLGQGRRERSDHIRVERDRRCMIDGQPVTAQQQDRFNPVARRKAADHVREAGRSSHFATRKKGERRIGRVVIEVKKLLEVDPSFPGP